MTTYLINILDFECSCFTMKDLNININYENIFLQKKKNPNHLNLCIGIMDLYFVLLILHANSKTVEINVYMYVCV